MQQAPYNNHADLSAFESDPFEGVRSKVLFNLRCTGLYSVHQPAIISRVFHEF